MQVKRVKPVYAQTHLVSEDAFLNLEDYLYKHKDYSIILVYKIIEAPS